MRKIGMSCSTWGWVLLGSLVVVTACGDGHGGPMDFDASGPGDAGVEGMADGEVDAGGDPHCDCVEGTCSTVVDESGTPRTVCNCDDGFGGERCDECAPGYAGERCDECDRGFEESEEVPGLCEPAPCDGVDCSGRGTCYVDVTETGILTARCACDPVFQGDICELCKPGYEGDDCETCAAGYTMTDGECVEDACVGVDCGHGSCDAGTCTCDEGYTGSSCDSCDTGYVPSGGECVPDGCAELECDHGTCVATLAGPICDCESGWDGTACDTCLPGYFPRTTGGVTTCVNELPVRDRRLLRSFDAAAAWTIVTDGMGRVEDWYERYGTKRLTTTTSLSRPQYHSRASRIDFDGVDDSLFTTAYWLIGGGESFSVFMVASWDPAGGVQTLIDSRVPLHDNQETYSLTALDANTLRFQLHDLVSPMSDVVVSDDFDATEGPQLIIVERRPFLTGHVLTVSNGTDVTTVEATNGPVFEMNMGTIGRCHEVGGPVPDCFLDGSVHELVVYDGELTAGERDDVIAYLRAKWGL